MADKREGGLGCLTCRDELVLEADVKSSVGVGCECHSRLSDYILGSSVFIADGVFDLSSAREVSNASFVTAGSELRGPLTCMLTTCPSPFMPSTIAVTSTSVSLPTKFRMHLSYLVLEPVCAARSNLRAQEKGRMAMKSSKLCIGVGHAILKTLSSGRVMKGPFASRNCSNVKCIGELNR